MAWMRMMGAESVAYHRDTIIGRGDDHPGAALAYYASRGETPLAWGGSGAGSLGLSGAVDNSSYDAIYGPGGAAHPSTGGRLVSAKRPGMELVIAAHKSVAELGVLGRAEDMHAIMDAERDATLAYLDHLTQQQRWTAGRGGGADGDDGTRLRPCPPRHYPAGDPGPHDHVLLANVVEMCDDKAGTKAPDTALWREHLHAATMVGRLAAAKVAVERGYGIEADDGPSGKLGHWRIAGIPEAALTVHSKRAAEINEAVAERGFATYQARQVAAREHAQDQAPHRRRRPLALVAGRAGKGRLPPRRAGRGGRPGPGRDYQRARPSFSRLSPQELSALAAGVLGPEGALSAQKVFSRRDVIVALAPHLYGRAPAELGRAVSAVLRDPDAVALVGAPRASERAYATARCSPPRRPSSAPWPGGSRRRRGQGGPRVWPGPPSPARSLASGPPSPPDSAPPWRPSRPLAARPSWSAAWPVRARPRSWRPCGDAFSAGGFSVVGTSTSGQAARTLGPGGRHLRSRDARLAALAGRPRPAQPDRAPRGGARRGRHGERPGRLVPGGPGPAGRGQGGHGRRRPPAGLRRSRRGAGGARRAPRRRRPRSLRERPHPGRGRAPGPGRAALG